MNLENLPVKSNMQNYHQLMRRIMADGRDILNERTGEVCRYITGAHLEFSMSDGFPAITTKKLPFKSCIGELLGFFRGYDNAADFEKVGTKVWYANANETEAWLKNPNRRGENDLGRIYGVNWNAWRDSRIANSIEERDRLLVSGYKVEVDGGKSFAMVRYINQLENALRMILTNPSDRRIIVTGWNPGELDQMALPPCHMTYTFVANEKDKTLDVEVGMRSWDTFLAFNIPLGAAFLEVMARLSGYKANKVILNATNAHIYGNHFEQVETMLSRDHYPAPKLELSENIKQVTVDQIEGVFSRIEPEDFVLQGYLHHEPIRAPMAR